MLQWEHSAILSTFTKLPFVIKTIVLSVYEWPFYTGFTVFDSLIIVAPIVYGGSLFGPCFMLYLVFFCVLALILMGKRQLVTLLKLPY